MIFLIETVHDESVFIIRDYYFRKLFYSNFQWFIYLTSLISFINIDHNNVEFTNIFDWVENTSDLSWQVESGKCARAYTPQL